MTNAIDHHVGKRIRRRRRLLGLTQDQLAKKISIRFQQVQKYESGTNRVSASRLFELAEALDVPVQYFYEGLQGPDANETAAPVDVLDSKEVQDMARAFLKLNERPRLRLLELARSLDPEKEGAPA